jgi:4-amino-4-deoxy-L-arabinose transferase-like glycosyltransferase
VNEPSTPSTPANGATRVEVFRRGERAAQILSPAGARGGCAAVAGLLLICLLVFIPGFFALPPVDRDEARFAQASRQMLEASTLPEGLRDPARHGGGILIPMLQERERLNKPPLIYWMQAGAAAVLTGARPHADRIWMYRIPSLLAAIALVLLTWRLGLLIFDPRSGAVAGALIAVSPLIAWEAHQARADMLLVAWTTLAQFALWRAFIVRECDSSAKALSPAAAVIFWIAIAAGILTKGPITPMVVGLTALGLSVGTRRWRWVFALRPLLGVVIVVLLVGPWVWAVGERIGWAQYLSTIGDEMWGRALAPKEGHWGPPGYHAVLLPILFWPGSLLTAAGLVLALRVVPSPAALRRRRNAPRASAIPQRTPIDRRDAAYVYLLAWIVPSWIIFELVSTKLPHYTMPLYPALAILSAHAVFAAEAGILPRLRERLGRLGFLLWLLIGGALVGVAISGLGLVVLSRGWLGTVLFTLAGITFLIVAFINLKLAARSWAVGKYARAQLAGVLVGIAVVIIVIGFAVPRLITLSPDIVAAIDAADPTGARSIALVQYQEDSMIFLTRGRAVRLGEEALAGWFEHNPRGLAVVPRRLAETIPWPHRQIDSFSGFNYVKGRIEDLVLIERAER